MKRNKNFRTGRVAPTRHADHVLVIATRFHVAFQYFPVTEISRVLEQRDSAHNHEPFSTYASLFVPPAVAPRHTVSRAPIYRYPSLSPSPLLLLSFVPTLFLYHPFSRPLSRKKESVIVKTEVSPSLIWLKYHVKYSVFV